MISIYNTTAASCAIGSDCWDTASRDHALLSDDGAVGRCPSSTLHALRGPTRSGSDYGWLRLCVSPVICFRTDVSVCQVHDEPMWCLAWPLAGGVSWVSGQHAGAIHGCGFNSTHGGAQCGDEFSLAELGLGHILALCYRSSAPYHICSDDRYLYF